MRKIVHGLFDAPRALHVAGNTSAVWGGLFSRQPPSGRLSCFEARMSLLGSRLPADSPPHISRPRIVADSRFNGRRSSTRPVSESTCLTHSQIKSYPRREHTRADGCDGIGTRSKAMPARGIQRRATLPYAPPNRDPSQLRPAAQTTEG